MPRAVDVAYHAIRKAILKGELRSGDKLPEGKLAQSIGVSRTPLREALNRLRSEGLVVIERYRKNYVAHFTEDDVKEIWQLRALLEGHAAARAAATITDADIARLEELATQMEVALAEQGAASIPVFDPLNDEFHMIIARAANSPRVTRVLESSLELPTAVLSGYDDEPGNNEETMEARLRRTNWQHREIIAALRVRNAKWAEAQMYAHLISLIRDSG